MPDDRTPVDTAAWRWALIRSDLPGAAIHVALTLAVRMDKDGTIPTRFKVGVRRIAKDAGAHRNTVGPALRTLVESGYIEETEPAVGTRPARYRAAVPSGTTAVPLDDAQWHNDCATSPVGNGSAPVGKRPDSVDDAGDSESLWHNADALVAQQTGSSGTTAVPHPAVPAESSTSSSPESSSGQGTPPAAPSVDLDDLPRVDRLRLLRRAHDDLVDRGHADPPIDVIHQRAHELLDADQRQAQA